MGRQALFPEGTFQQMCRFDDIGFGRPRDFICIIQTIEAADPILVRPIKPYQLDPCRHHLISVTIQRRVNEDISSRRLYTTVISRFLEGAR